MGILGYADILLTESSRNRDFTTDINYKSSGVNEAFNKAGKGQDSFTQSITDSIINKPAPTLVRSSIKLRGEIVRDDEVAKELTSTIASFWINTYSYGYISAENKKILKDTKQRLISLIDPPEAGKLYIEQKELELHNALRSVEKEVLDSLNKRNLPPELKSLIVERAKNPAISVEGEKQKARVLKQYSKKYPNIEQEFNTLEDFFRKKYDEAFENLHKSFQYYVEQMRHRSGTQFQFNKDKSFIVVAKPENDIQRNFQKIFEFMPGISCPFTPEEFSFLIGLHEGEHATRKFNTQGLSSNTQYVLEETDCDYAIINFLKDLVRAGDPTAQAKIDFWLQMRNVSSFIQGVDNYFGHDTATYIRVMEASNGKQQLDPDKFLSEKTKLMAKIRTQLGTQPQNIENILSAAHTVYENDKSLTKAQKTQLESLFDDAKALNLSPAPTQASLKPPVSPARPQDRSFTVKT